MSDDDDGEEGGEEGEEGRSVRCLYRREGATGSEARGGQGPDFAVWEK